MNASELRQKYLDFFKSKGHAIIPNASLIPENDPTALFTSAGMHPLVPYLMGEKHPAGKRLVNCQKCIRTTDIDEVGDTTHHTFLEMLGNWSLGDYFKKDAITWSWEFLTSPQWLNLNKNRIAASVFEGDNDAPFDEDAYNIWFKDVGIKAERIAKLPKEDNWWGPAGETGPCGPDTEMFYWVGDKPTPKKFNPKDKKWVEIWNDVFMQYFKNEKGKYELLKQKNVDTGMGLERLLAVMNGLDDDYRTELFVNVITKIEELSGKKYNQSEEITRSMRIIADHIKAAVFIMGDNKGIAPSNLDQGYVVRRLIRRAIRYGRQIGITDQTWTKEIAKIVVQDYREVYSELLRNIDFIIKQFEKEEAKFSKTLGRGLLEFNKWITKPVVYWVENPPKDLSKKISESPKIIPGFIVFKLFSTYGFPIEITKELAEEKGLTVDEAGFKIELEKHQELSRTASAGKFKGGLADASEETKKLHTAAHLLLAALRQVLGDHVVQKGSNITPQRLRFDFSHSEKMTEEQKRKVKKLVNNAIGKNLDVICEEMSLDEAKKQNAMGVFESKYDEKVKVYTVGNNNEIFSKEICGGPHVEKTGILGKFKIIKEQSSSAGVRRIKAILQ